MPLGSGDGRVRPQARPEWKPPGTPSGPGHRRRTNVTASFSMELGGRTMTLETGRLAKQAGGSVLVKYGESVVLCTVE